MKKVLLFTMSIIMVLFLCACTKTNKENKPDDGGQNKVSEEAKSVVLYFSAIGTTKSVANKISGITNSDIIEIVPKNKYTSEDLNYNNDNSRANKEQNDDKSRPEIENLIDISKYDTVYLGYPIWWGTIPRIIYTLLDTVDLNGKKIILFCTSGSTGIEKSISDIKKYKNSLNIIDGKRLSSSVTNEEISSWLNSLKIVNVDKMYIKVNGKVLTVNLENNSSSLALVEKLKEQDIKIEMSDYGNFEKVGPLGFTLPTNDKEIVTGPGDVILYQGDKITIYYDTNKWSFTKLGKIDIDSRELTNILGTNNVTVTLTINK